MQFAVSSLLALIAAVVAAQPATSLTFNPPANLVHPVGTSPGVGSPTPSPKPATNGKRFAIGLPPLSPRARRRHRLRSPHGGSKAGTARRSTTSPVPPITTKCKIFATGTDGTSFGYLAPVWNGFGEYGQFQSSEDGALEVSFSLSPDASSQLDFLATNGPSSTYPYFGAISGFASDSDDFSVGSYNYAYIGGTTQSAAGSPPFGGGDNSFSAATGTPETIESAVWSYDHQSKAITAQWVNTDGSAPATHIVFVNDSNQALAITGDVGAFQSALGVPYPEVTLTCGAPRVVQTPV